MEDQKTIGIRDLQEQLSRTFDFSIERRQEPSYYYMRTDFIHFGFEGKRVGTETYYLTLRCDPASLSDKGLDMYTCGAFGLKIGAAQPVSIVALKAWQYKFNMFANGEKAEPVFGVPHEVFEGLQDSVGRELPPDIRYAIYNNFIDFHALNDSFSRPMFGRGVERLSHVGERIIHSAAYAAAPVSLGSVVRPGSVFHNGEVSLELKGVSSVDGSVCALIGYDSGESTFEMTMASADGPDKSTVGGSRYKGDLYIELETGWVSKATLDESVVTESSLVGGKEKEKQFTARNLMLRMISQEDFRKEPHEICLASESEK